MPEYPDNFDLKPGSTATIELKYNAPKTGVVGSGPKEGDAWILYSVQVNNDGKWRSWFTSPGSTAYDAHKMIQKRGYKPGLSLDIELSADSKWTIRGETWDDIFGEPKEKPLSPENQATLDEHLKQGAPQNDSLAAVIARLDKIGGMVKDMKADVDWLRKNAVPF